MGQASIALNGRLYHLSCGAGEEQRLELLSQVVRGKLDRLVAEYGQVGDDRLLLMTALMLADEMLEARARVDALEEAFVALQQRLAAEPA